MKTILVFFAMVQLASGQIILQNTRLQNAQLNMTNAVASGSSTFTLVDHSISGASSISTTTTTLSTIGAKLLVFSASFRRSGGGTDTGPTCNGGSDTPVSGVAIGGPSGNGTNQLFYVINPTQTGTYSITMTRDYVVLSAQSFSYSGTTPAFDTAASGSGSDSYTTISPGAISGTVLFITGLANVFQSAETSTIDSSFTITDQLLQTSGGAYGAMAYKSASSTQTPTWTSSTSGVPGGTAGMSFK